MMPSYSTLLTLLCRFLPRTISPQALTSLLAALASLFKHLLLPSLAKPDAASNKATSSATGLSEPAADADVLHISWEHLCSVLGKCNPEVQRAVAEVWSTVLRRLKGTTRDRHVKSMLLTQAGGEGKPSSKCLEAPEDALAWMVVFACKVRTSGLPTRHVKSLTEIILEYRAWLRRSPQPPHPSWPQSWHATCRSTSSPLASRRSCCGAS